jgi:hypothetical protein
MTPYEPDDSNENFDNHSGTRLVLLLFLVPLTVFAGWIAWRVVVDLAMGPLGHQQAMRAGYVGSGLAMAGTIYLILRMQYAFSRRSQAETDETIDDMRDDEEDD